MAEKHSDKTPQHEINALARCLLPEIQKFFASPEGQKEFEEWKDKFRQGVTQWDCKHEGYVFEDQNGYRVKFIST